MKVVTPEQMNEIDRRTIQEAGIPGIVLMENAALSVTGEIIKELGPVPGKKIAVFAGKGNNGGDAFAVARHLYNRGAEVRVFLLGRKEAVAGDARVNLDILERLGQEVVELLEKEQMDRVFFEIAAAHLLVDGIFGTGLRGEVTGLAREIIEAINRSGKPVISVDIPSGVSGETGKILGACVKAKKTVTFSLPKAGLVVHPGCEYAGELVVSDISIPSKVVDSLGIKTNLTEEKYVSGLIPSRRSESNKGDYGRVLLITGSVGMTGAGCLCAGAALRAGAGLVYIGVPSALAPIYETSIMEAVTIPLEDNGSGYLSRRSIDRVLDALKRSTAVAVGPGLSVSDEIFEIIARVVEEAESPVILDADALNAVSRDVPVLKKLKCGGVVTPHPGEMARLTGKTVKDIQENRIETAREFSAKWGTITVLKGARTVIASPDGEVFINPTGNSGMATGGTGDVLTGIIAGLVAQGLKPLEAAVAGVYLHGLAGDNTAEIKGEHGLIAGDLVEQLPHVMKRMVKVGR
ncbi:MAG: NAD(P)H-hydrate dehydratase [Clostridiales bacterium]|jgi:NAD(P)H-hydrate epimerase|nr:NAD(P)H-hydrate dehydratase [Eubacteriales bacterium]MDH7567815.1 NAD(P)H-hydrate dehydratase [Clostridiales bacterium]